jgi:phage replication O-like protein O
VTKNNHTGTPQLEDGYTKIADEFLEWLCRCPLLKDSTRIILAIIRLTWGFNEKKAKIRNNKISEITSIDRHRVSRKLKELKDKNVVQNDNKTGKIGINKRYTGWKLHKSTTKRRCTKVQQVLHKSTTSVAQKYNPLIYTKNIKENIKNTPQKKLVSEIQEYFESNGLNEEKYKSLGQEFYKYYAALGWRIRGSEIVDWRLIADGWIKRRKEPKGMTEREKQLNIGAIVVESPDEKDEVKRCEDIIKKLKSPGHPLQKMKEKIESAGAKTKEEVSEVLDRPSVDKYFSWERKLKEAKEGLRELRSKEKLKCME